MTLTGGFAASVALGCVPVANALLRSRESIVGYLVIRASFALPSSVGLSPCVAAGEGCTCPQETEGLFMPQPRVLLGLGGVSLQEQGLTVLPLPLRPLDDFRMTSLLEISLHFFLEHRAIEILRKLLLSGPGSSSGEMSILMSLLMVQSHSMRSMST